MQIILGQNQITKTYSFVSSFYSDHNKDIVCVFYYCGKVINYEQ